MNGIFKLEKDLKLAARGRPKGLPKTGGRKKGSVDKLKREAEIAASGLTPLHYMLGIVRAETPSGLDASVAIARETLRFEAARKDGERVRLRLIIHPQQKPGELKLAGFCLVTGYCFSEGGSLWLI